MWYILAGVITVVMLGVGFWKRSNNPSVAMFGEIERAVRQLQCKAVDHVMEDGSDYIARFNADSTAGQTVTIRNIFRMIYTVEHIREGFLHTISSQLKRAKGGNYHEQCTLIVMMVLQRELEEAGIKQDDVELQLEQSEFGTQYIYMLLDSNQHSRLSQRIKQGTSLDKMPGSRDFAELCVPILKRPGKKKNKVAYTWKETECEEIQKPFTNENFKNLLKDGSKESDAEYTHQQIADWCRRWVCEDHNDRMDVPRELLDILEDVDIQWELYLANTYSYEDLTSLDFTQVRLPVDWFSNWSAKLDDYIKQSVSLDR